MITHTAASPRFAVLLSTLLTTSAALADEQPGFIDYGRSILDSALAKKNATTRLIDPQGSLVGLVREEKRIAVSGDTDASDGASVGIGMTSIHDARIGALVRKLNIETGSLAAGQGGVIEIGNLKVDKTTGGVLLEDTTITTRNVRAIRDGAVHVGGTVLN